METIDKMEEYSIYMTRPKTIAEQLYKARLEQHMSRRELTDLCGISGNSIAAIESGLSAGNINTLEAMAHALGYKIVLIKEQ